MFHNKFLFVLVVTYWLCLVSEAGVLTTKKTLPTPTNPQVKNNELDCSQFKNDFDILRQLPFPVLINQTIDEDYTGSAVALNGDKTFVKSIQIQSENTFPLSVFCLSNLTSLRVDNTSFENGIVPDALANLKKLETLLIYRSPIKMMTELLGTLTNLDQIRFFECGLESLPDITNLRKLRDLTILSNNLSHIDRIPSVEILYIVRNNLTEIPILKNPKKLKELLIVSNPLKNAIPLLLYENLEALVLDYTTLTSIPPNIDKLQKLEFLSLANNKLTHFPTGLFNLPKLEYLNIAENLFSVDDIKSIKKAFKKSHPNLELDI